MTDVVYKNGKILKHYEVGYIEDNLKYTIDLKEWEKSRKITKIKYEVGDECVFEISKGNKKWTIPLDDFFDKVIQICGVDKDE
jgi:hypothetical protein